MVISGKSKSPVKLGPNDCDNNGTFWASRNVMSACPSIFRGHHVALSDLRGSDHPAHKHYPSAHVFDLRGMLLFCLLSSFLRTALCEHSINDMSYKGREEISWAELVTPRLSAWEQSTTLFVVRFQSDDICLANICWLDVI